MKGRDIEISSHGTEADEVAYVVGNKQNDLRMKVVVDTMFSKFFELESCGSVQEVRKTNHGTMLRMETGGCYMYIRMMREKSLGNHSPTLSNA